MVRHEPCGSVYPIKPLVILKGIGCYNCSRSKKLSNEEIVTAIQKFFKENDRLPTSMDFINGRPNSRSIIKLFGSWKSALEFAGLDLEYDNNKKKEKIKREIIEFFKLYGKVPTSRDIKRNKMFTCTDMTVSSYFGSIKNALDEAGVLRYTKHKNLFDREKYDEEEVKMILLRKSKEKGRILTNDEIDKDNELPHSSTVNRIVEGITEFAKSNNLSLNHCIVPYIEKDVISWVKNFYAIHGKVPSSADIDNQNDISSFATIMKNFNDIYELYEASGIQDYKKRSKFYSNQEIVEMWKDIKDNLGRTPYVHELFSKNGENIHSAIGYRWNNYYNFLVSINEHENYKPPMTNYKFITEKGTECLSTYEFTITSYLEEKGIKFEKEYLYRKAIKGDNSRRRFDWKIETPKGELFIEMFGVGNRFGYREKTIRKINDCKNSNVNLIALFPEVFNKGMIYDVLDEIFIEYNLIKSNKKHDILAHKYLVNHPDWSHEEYITQAN